ncbi:type VI secretion system transmembrane protein TssO [Mucilaginibacter sp.]
MVKFTLKERRERFLFFLGLFLLTAGVLCTALFYNYNAGLSVSKKEYAQRIEGEEQFEAVVAEAQPAIDTTYAHIVKFNPNVQALFLENDIKNSLGAIKSYYNRKPYDNRYKCFIYASKLYDNLFYDRRELRGNYNDISHINKLLDDCKLSTRQLQESFGAGARR